MHRKHTTARILVSEQRNTSPMRLSRDVIGVTALPELASTRPPEHSHERHSRQIHRSESSSTIPADREMSGRRRSRSSRERRSSVQAPVDPAMENLGGSVTGLPAWLESRIHQSSVRKSEPATFTTQPRPFLMHPLPHDYFYESKTCLSEIVERTNPDGFLKHLFQVGSGQTSAVYQARDVRTDSLVALKVMDMSYNEPALLASEVLIHRSMVHDNIVTLYKVCEYFHWCFLVMELAERGSLSTYLIRNDWTEPHMAYVIQSVLNALEYIHAHDIIFRDVRSDNVAIAADGVIKLLDFGCAARIPDVEAERYPVRGTPYWMAPELIQGFAYGTAVDIWALGILSLELAHGNPPHAYEAATKAMSMIVVDGLDGLSGRIWTPEFKDFIALCLQKEAAKRPSATELLAHPFVKTACTQRAFLAFLTPEVAPQEKPALKRAPSAFAFD
jgi:hypothetical protein